MTPIFQGFCSQEPTVGPRPQPQQIPIIQKQWVSCLSAVQPPSLYSISGDPSSDAHHLSLCWPYWWALPPTSMDFCHSEIGYIIQKQWVTIWCQNCPQFQDSVSQDPSHSRHHSSSLPSSLIDPAPNHSSVSHVSQNRYRPHQPEVQWYLASPKTKLTVRRPTPN